MNGQPQNKPDLAQERTDMAEDRTLMAVERTFAGWFRTGYAAVAIGLGFQALFVQMDPQWVPRAIATAFLLIGIYLFVSAERRSAKVLERLHAHKAQPVGNSYLRIMMIASSAAVVALIAAMWLVPVKSA
jgi:putative membrane protein